MRSLSYRSQLVVAVVIMNLVLIACGGNGDDASIDPRSDGRSSTVHDMSADASADVALDASIDVELGDDTDTGLDHAASGRCAPELELYQDGNCERLVDGIIEYAPQYPLWSDGTVKYRFAYLPPGR